VHTPRACRFSFFLRAAGRPGAAASILSGCYAAVKGGLYAERLRSAGLALRNAVYGQQRYGTRRKEIPVEEGAPTAVVLSVN
jgi:hypothetical protein